jgi:transposase
MDVLYERCCGLDVHKKTVVACCLTPGKRGVPTKVVRTFGTMTADLEALATWLGEQGCTHVVMESTGVYWKPVWNVLEGHPLTLLLANARRVKGVPGRKTDVKDAEWLADLLRHGLIAGSYVPDRAQRELQELTRYRTQLRQERAAMVNRLHKTLEGANVKLGAVASDLLGASGRAMLEQLVAGCTDPATLAELARGRLREKRPVLQQALAGSFGPHQQFLIAEQLTHIDELDERLARLDAEVAERLRPVQPVLDRLDTIPGVGRRTAELILAEGGTDLRHFRTAGHFASWAGLCPGHAESAGKQRSGRMRKGNRWLRKGLTEAARAAARTKNTYLGAQYRRLASRRGRNRACGAVAHSILTIGYHLVRDGTTYQELGANYYDERERSHVERRLVRRLEALGHTVTLAPKDPAA